jgi:periplasmic copper chaperone A
MNTVPNLRRLSLAAMLGLALAGCQQSGTPEVQPSEAATGSMGPDAKPGITAEDGRLVLPAVAGRPGVAYFTLRNGTEAAVTLAGAHIAGAGKAEMHRTQGGKMTPVDQLAIAPGETSTFAPGGLHVMAFDIADTLKPGMPSELTLTFADGDKVSVPLRVEAMGAMAMPGVKH